MSTKMLLEIENLGLINKVDLEIGKINVIVSKNSTGKSTLSKFLFSLLTPVSICLFGSYAKGNANEDSDLDFVMDKGELKGYISFNDLEKEVGCHVDLISKGSSNKKFLNKIKKDEVLLYERK